jgi:hypothetical protein
MENEPEILAADGGERIIRGGFTGCGPLNQSMSRHAYLGLPMPWRGRGKMWFDLLMKTCGNEDIKK